MRRSLLGLLVAIACSAAEPPQSPVIVPVSGHVTAVLDRWTPSCPQPAPIYPRAWDSTFADTAIVFAAPMNVDSIASVFGVSRRDDGRFWYDFEGRGGEGSSGTESAQAGPWLVVTGQYQTMTYVDNIYIPADSSGRIAPEHYRQSWFFAFAPTTSDCAVVIAWRSPSIGSYRGPRYLENEIDVDSLRAFLGRVQWRDSLSR